MITKANAEVIALEEIKKLESPSMPFGINKPETIEKPFGWVFFYNTQKFLDTGDSIYQLAGNGPIIVNRDTGAVTRGRSNQAIDAFIEEYERSLEK